MKLSSLTIEDIKEYSHIYTSEDNKILDIILSASKNYILSRTGLTAEEADTKEDLTIALLTLASEMYDNRAYSVDTDKLNPLVEQILFMYSVNLI